jgi:hypothetical protein
MLNLTGSVTLSGSTILSTNTLVTISMTIAPTPPIGGKGVVLTIGVLLSHFHKLRSGIAEAVENACFFKS